MPNPQLATSSRHGINPPNFALSKYPGFGHLVLVVWGRSILFLGVSISFDVFLPVDFLGVLGCFQGRKKP